MVALLRSDTIAQWYYCAVSLLQTEEGKGGCIDNVDDDRLYDDNDELE